MLILRIRQAEVALNDGRLDEACELCQSQRLRSHRKGQALVTRLVQALVKRGHAHLNASRPQQALVDCEKAQRFGGNLAEVVELVGRVGRHLRDRRPDDQGREYLVGLAPVVGPGLGDHDRQRHGPRVGGYVDRGARLAAINWTRPRRLTPFSEDFLEPSRRI